MEELKDFKNIQEIRDSIDKIDHRILELFGARNHLVKEIVKYKTDTKEVVAKERQAVLFASRRKWAEDLNLDPDLFEKIFKMLIDSNIHMELEMLEQKKKKF
jgi:chorismate mutase